MIAAITTAWVFLKGHARAAFVGLAVLGLVILYSVAKHEALAKLAVQLVEAHHAPKIAVLQAQIQAQSTDLAKNQAAVTAAQAEVAQRKDAIHQVYDVVGLSSSEIAVRFNKLGVK